MINNKILFLGVFTSLLIIIINYPSNAFGGDNQNDLELIIFTDKNQFVLGEPVKISFNLRNTGTEILFNDFFINFDFDRIEILISENSGEFEIFLSQKMFGSRLAKQVFEPVILEPGASIISSEFISFNILTDDFAFPTSGTFEIKAILTFDEYQKTLESNIVSIMIDEPSGIDVNALEHIISNNLQKFLTEDRQLFPESLDDQLNIDLDEFKTLFPASTYAQFIDLSQKSDLILIKELVNEEGNEDLIKFSVTIFNEGPDDTENIVITDQPDNVLIFNAGESSSDCSLIGNEVICNITNINAGFSNKKLIGFNIPPEFTGTIENNAKVLSDNDDPNLSNNEDSVEIELGQEDQDNDGIPDDEDPAPNDPCIPNPNSQACKIPPRVPVGGTGLPIETTSLILAGAQSFSWMIPVVLSIVGIGLIFLRRK